MKILQTSDDTISNPVIGQSHDRIVWRGSVQKIGMVSYTRLVILLTTIQFYPNFDTTVKEVDQYLGRTNTLANSQLSDVARFNTGYNRT